MHKQLLNEATIELTLEPDGPILIKAGDTGADPTRPDMEFVRTFHENGERTIYLPGSSLKGVIRAHCERIVRSLDQSGHKACYPLDKETVCVRDLIQKSDEEVDGPKAFRTSCFICQIFGNTVLAGHLRTADAYPLNQKLVRTEQRDGVAIDRVFGSVAVGPFQFEVATAGQFKVRLGLHNFSLAQLGLIGLALRDIKLGRVGIGFGKSRGLGRVKATFDAMTIRYPTGQVVDGQVRLLNGGQSWPVQEVLGVGRFPGLNGYHYPTGSGEQAALPPALQFKNDDWGEATVTAEGDQVEDIWRACMPAWREAMQ
ncbi:MAG: CRISPR-associated protein [Anaerolineae bacterium]|nr:CRISPR-associated protein [Anaerolineae bacterium]